MANISVHYFFHDSSSSEAVVGDEVGRAGNVAGGHDSGVGLAGELLEAVGHLLDTGDALESHDVGGETGNVGGGHGSSAQGGGVAVAADAAGLDTDTGGEDVNEGTKVGEGGAAVVGLINSTDSDGGLGRARGGEGSVLVLVTGGNNGNDTGSLDTVDGGVDGLGERAAERHVHDGLATETTAGGITGNKVHTGNHARVGTGTVSTEDLDSNELGLLGDTKLPASNGASNVGAVAVEIRLIFASDEGGAESGPPLQVLVGGTDTSVHNVSSDALSSRTVKEITILSGTVMAEAGQAGRGARLKLADIELDDGILLDVADLLGGIDLIDQGIIGLQSHSSPLVDLEGLDCRRKDVVGQWAALPNVALGDHARNAGLVGKDLIIAEGVVVDHDELVGDEVLGIGVGDGHTDIEPLGLGEGGGRSSRHPKGRQSNAQGNKKSASHC